MKWYSRRDMNSPVRSPRAFYMLWLQSAPLASTQQIPPVGHAMSDGAGNKHRVDNPFDGTTFESFKKFRGDILDKAAGKMAGAYAACQAEPLRLHATSCLCTQR